MVFREHRADFEKYAQQLLEEIPEQIREYMESNNIFPNNEKVKEKLRLQAHNIEEEENKDQSKIEDYTDKYLKELKEGFINDVMSIGFDRHEIEEVIKEGLPSMDKFLIFEVLNAKKAIKLNQKEEALKNSIRTKEEMKELRKEKMRRLKET